MRRDQRLSIVSSDLYLYIIFTYDDSGAVMVPESLSLGGDMDGLCNTRVIEVNQVNRENK